jgi:imidazolonepropionase-like amidohydrolase
MKRATAKTARRAEPMLLFTLLAPLLLAGGGDAPVVLRAGTIHLVEGGSVLTDGAVLVRDGKIVSAGVDIVTPAGATEIDYGPDAVIIPGIVAADSTLGDTEAGPRTADVALRAEDNFNTFVGYESYSRSGVTTAYVAPARGRLIAGKGAVVKLSSKRGDSRVLKAAANLHGAVTTEARSTPGFWEPPIPATVDVGIGVPQKQLPLTAMGAVIALDELMVYAKGGDGADKYGDAVGPGLAEWIKEDGSWRLGASTAAEIQAVLGFAQAHSLPLVVDGGADAGSLAADLAAGEARVVLSVDTSGTIRDRGKEADSRWREEADASALAEAGVEFAISSRSARTTLSAAALSVSAGLSEAAALQAVTLSAANILGVGDRVGSIAPGKEADLVVLNGSPAQVTTSVLATWVDGALSWESESEGSIVLEVDELHIGDGEVLSPGQVLVSNGRIVEVGRVVSHPNACRVVRGVAAMPGMIDARGHLGLEGSTKTPSSSFSMARIFEPGDETDRRVAMAGVTTVALTPRNVGPGTTATVYKPAASELGAMMVEPNAVAYAPWDNADPLVAGAAVRQLIQKGAAYKKSWDEYAKQIASWKPEAEAAEEDEEGEAEEEAEEEEEKEEKKPKKPKSIPPFELTGVWEAEAESGRLRLQLLQDGEAITGRLRSDAVSAEVVELVGSRVEHALSMSGLAPEGEIKLEGSTEESNTDGISFTVTATGGGEEVTISLERVSEEYRVAERPELRKPEAPESAPKGQPKRPKLDMGMEPIRAAMEGRGRLMVSVSRPADALECVKLCNSHGIKPVLVTGSGVAGVADQLKGKVTGVLATSVSAASSLSRAGIAVAFGSGAEEGAADLPAYVASGIRSGLSPSVVVRSLTGDAAAILGVDGRVGRIAPGMDGDILFLKASPFTGAPQVARAWVAGEEIK